MSDLKQPKEESKKPENKQLDSQILNYISKTNNLNSINKKNNYFDGDDKLSLYQLQNAKKHKDSLTYRSRMNRNTNIKFLKSELLEHENKCNWWERDDRDDFK